MICECCASLFDPRNVSGLSILKSAAATPTIELRTDPWLQTIGWLGRVRLIRISGQFALAAKNNRTAEGRYLVARSTYHDLMSFRLPTELRFGLRDALLVLAAWYPRRSAKPISLGAVAEACAPCAAMLGAWFLDHTKEELAEDPFRGRPLPRRQFNT